jgi:hypothetical protein
MAAMPMPNYGYDARMSQLFSRILYCNRKNLFFATILQKENKKILPTFFILFHFFQFCSFHLNTLAKENTFSIKQKQNWILRDVLKFRKLFSKEANEFLRQCV